MWSRSGHYVALTIPADHDPYRSPAASYFNQGTTQPHTRPTNSDTIRGIQSAIRFPNPGPRPISPCKSSYKRSTYIPTPPTMALIPLMSNTATHYQPTKRIQHRLSVTFFWLSSVSIFPTIYPTTSPVHSSGSRGVYLRTPFLLYAYFYSLCQNYHKPTS